MGEEPHGKKIGCYRYRHPPTLQDTRLTPTVVTPYHALLDDAGVVGRGGALALAGVLHVGVREDVYPRRSRTPRLVRHDGPVPFLFCFPDDVFGGEEKNIRSGTRRRTKTKSQGTKNTQNIVSFCYCLFLLAWRVCARACVCVLHSMKPFNLPRTGIYGGTYSSE